MLNRRRGQRPASWPGAAAWAVLARLQGHSGGCAVRGVKIIGMPRTCTVCAHSDRAEIDQRLLAGEPFRRIAARFGTSASALVRHKGSDIPGTLVQAKQAADDVQADTLFERVKGLAAEAKAILEEARASNNHSVALQAIGRAEKLLELEARLLGELNDAAKIAIGINVSAAGPEYDFSRLSNEQLAQRAERVAERIRQLA